jgi:tRNA A37 N6-isopentenylltransferase MiaA
LGLDASGPRVLVSVGGTLQLAHAVANRLAKLGQFAWTEDQQNDTENNEQMHRLQHAHAHEVSPLSCSNLTSHSRRRSGETSENPAAHLSGGADEDQSGDAQGMISQPNIIA